MKMRIAGFLAATATVAACSPTEVCHHGIWLEAAPADTTLAIGGAFEPEVWLEQCPDPRAVEATLSTGDERVVVISDGEIRAVGAGAATVTATAEGLTATLSIQVVD